MVMSRYSFLSQNSTGFRIYDENNRSGKKNEGWIVRVQRNEFQYGVLEFIFIKFHVSF